MTGWLLVLKPLPCGYYIAGVKVMPEQLVFTDDKTGTGVTGADSAWQGLVPIDNTT